MFFNRPWTSYQQGFGSPTSLYWIGLDRLHQLTQINCQVRFDLQDTGGTWHYAQYSNFSVDNSSTNYTLTIGGWSGDAGDAMSMSNGQQFSTYDADHDGFAVNCASWNGGGFWFGSWCTHALITTSTDNNGFLSWYSMKLNVVKVSLWC